MDPRQLAEHLRFFQELGVNGVSRDAAWRRRSAAGHTPAERSPGSADNQAPQVEIVDLPVIRSPKDVLAHIMAWQQRCMAWIHNGGGDEPVFTEEGMAAYNAGVFAKHKDRTLDEVRSAFESTHAEIVSLIEGMSPENVAAPPPWADPIPLVAILSSNTDEHYRVHTHWLTRWLESTASKAAS